MGMRVRRRDCRDWRLLNSVLIVEGQDVAQAWRNSCNRQNIMNNSLIGSVGVGEGVNEAS